VEYICGQFEVLSLGDLRKNIDLNSELVRSVFNSGDGSGISVKNLSDDVSNQHHKPRNKLATFQGASQFNCLEFASAHGSPENGVTCYAMDKTQGPCCAVTCSPGTVVRNYFAFDKHKTRTEAFDFLKPDAQCEGMTIAENLEPNEPQMKNRQLNCLDQIDTLLQNNNTKYFTVKNGYTDSTNAKLIEFNKFMDETPGILEKMANEFHSGIQFDTEVVAPNFGNNIVFSEDPAHKILVTQVYNSAISVSYSNASVFKWEKFAQFILDCAYEFSFYVGVLNALKHNGKDGSKKLYLTKLGGGVFGNQDEWIIKSIRKALKKFKTVGLEVYIVNYGAIEPAFKTIGDNI
jgi:hypothetical protein